MMYKLAAVQQAKLEMARRDFYFYCQLKAPDFYKPDRVYLKDLCDSLQEFYESSEAVMLVNMPPRTGKSRTLTLFVQWVLGIELRIKIMCGSYNTILSTDFSKGVRDGITEEKADAGIIVYSDVFPKSKIKYGDAAMNKWSLEGAYNSYLATSPDGSATGFGCKILILDDLIKNEYEANNEIIKAKILKWFTDTMLSRLEQNGKLIVVMTRWATDDLAGWLLTYYKGRGKTIRHIKYKALQDDGTMLCDEILSRETYEERKLLTSPNIFMANYQQEPIDIKGRLYSSFKTYTSLPVDLKGQLLFTDVRNYTDTADEGNDYLCAINYGVYNGDCYVLDILYTKDPMEMTEPALARMLHNNKVHNADIESNNGGRGFGRAVKRELAELCGWNRTVINMFYQSKNKRARILSNATWVMNHVYYPVNWRDRWPEYHDAMVKYQKEGKNAHDDGPDATTGIAEHMTAGMRVAAINIDM